MGVTPSNSHILLRITPHRFLFKSLPPLFLKSSCNNGIFFPFPIITNSLSFLRPVTNSCKTSVLIFLIMKIERLYYLYLSSSSNALNVEKLNALILANIFPVIYFIFRVMPSSMQDLSSPTRGQTDAPYIGSMES